MRYPVLGTALGNRNLHQNVRGVRSRQNEIHPPVRIRAGGAMRQVFGPNVRDRNFVEPGRRHGQFRANGRLVFLQFRRGRPTERPRREVRRQRHGHRVNQRVHVVDGIPFDQQHRVSGRIVSRQRIGFAAYLDPSLIGVRRGLGYNVLRDQRSRFDQIRIDPAAFYDMLPGLGLRRHILIGREADIFGNGILSRIDGTVRIGPDRVPDRFVGDPEGDVQVGQGRIERVVLRIHVRLLRRRRNAVGDGRRDRGQKGGFRGVEKRVLRSEIPLAGLVQIRVVVPVVVLRLHGFGGLGDLVGQLADGGRLAAGDDPVGKGRIREVLQARNRRRKGVCRAQGRLRRRLGRFHVHDRRFYRRQQADTRHVAVGISRRT